MKEKKSENTFLDLAAWKTLDETTSCPFCKVRLAGLRRQTTLLKVKRKQRKKNIVLNENFARSYRTYFSSLFTVNWRIG